MNRVLTLGLLFSLALFVGPMRAADDDDDEKPSSKTALKALNDFIGSWKGSGEKGTNIWKEQVDWSWRFKGDDAWLTMTIKNGKEFKGGELRYLPEKKKYQLTATTKDNDKVIYTGELKKDVLTLEHTDADKETHRIKMQLATGGARLMVYFDHKPARRTLFTKDYLVSLTKDGETIGAKEKKVECPVTGGLGKIPVNYKGVTYYVCCSGCLEAFNENPEKFVKEFEAKKKKEQ